MKINKLSLSDNWLTERLAPLSSAPESLYCLGSLPSSPQLVAAIVGSRKPTSYGRQVTIDLSRSLANKGTLIVSGLALGVDAIAHQACIDAGGTTIAVLASGVDNPTPRTNAQLARRILEQGGALISEYPSGTCPRPYMFLERNRLVSGIADVIIVTEANLRSGTLSTVAHALVQGKDVYAVPGPITSPLSAGCNRLIAQGATPIVSVESFIEELYGQSNTKDSQVVVRGDTKEEQIIIDLIRQGIQDGDELLIQSGLEQSEFMSCLTMLELKTLIRPLGNNMWSL